MKEALRHLNQPVHPNSTLKFKLLKVPDIYPAFKCRTVLKEIRGYEEMMERITQVIIANSAGEVKDYVNIRGTHMLNNITNFPGLKLETVPQLYNDCSNLLLINESCRDKYIWIHVS